MNSQQKYEQKREEIDNILKDNESNTTFQQNFAYKTPSDKGILDVYNEKPAHYNNDKGSIYKFCNDQELNPWEFDIIKRIVRCRRKGQFNDDLEKTKMAIDLYLTEYNGR